MPTTLILGQADVRRLLPMRECIDLVAKALEELSAGQAVNPLRSVMALPGAQTRLLGLMPGYLASPEALGLKVVAVFPGNHGTAYDSHQGLVALFDPRHGFPLAILDATEITAIRTAAASGVATRLLARDDAQELAILGSGTQARTHLEAMLAVRPIRKVRVFSATAANSLGFAKRESAQHGVEVVVADSAEAAVRGADIVCTATSSSRPVLFGAWLTPGVHVNAVGASGPSERELDSEAFARSRLFVDRRESAENESGAYRTALAEGAITREHIQGEIGEVVAGRIPGRRSSAEITLFKSLGVAVEDLAAARHVLSRAREQGLGTPVELGDYAMQPIEAISIDDIRAARERIRGSALRTPLVRLEVEDLPAEIWLKLENLQPIGSFKLRGAGNAMALADPARLAEGVITASAGNMAQGVAWNARRLGVRCDVVVPDHAPAAKLDAVRRLGGNMIKLPFDDWWQVLVDHGYPGLSGLFIHPVSDRNVIAGNGTIGLEILEDMPDVDTILVPYGGGGLSCGIASATRSLAPAVRVLGCEVETAAPLSASLAAGEPATVDYHATFVDGIGSRTVLKEMWPLASSLLAGALVSTIQEIVDAVRLLVTRNHVVAEGAGAAAVAAALSGRAGEGKIVCVVSGGNIEPSRLGQILAGQVPA